MGLIKCTRYNNCRICQSFDAIGEPAPWKEIYCEGLNMVNCARFKYYEEWKISPPIYLLPNGHKATGSLKHSLEDWAEKNK